MVSFLSKEDRKGGGERGYSPCALNEKRSTWEEILQLKKSICDSYWCVLGGFNTVRRREESVRQVAPDILRRGGGG